MIVCSWYQVLEPTGKGLDGQGPRRGGHSDDASYTNQQSPYGTPQNTQSNFGDLPANRLSQQNSNPATSSNQSNPPSIQLYSGGYYAGNYSTAGANALNQGAYQPNNYAPVGLPRQYTPQSYYAPSTSVPPYQALQLSVNNPLAYDPPQYPPRQHPQLQMLQEDDYDNYDLDQAQPQLPQQLPQQFALPPHLPHPLSQPGRSQAALLQSPQPPLRPPQPPLQPAALAAQAIPYPTPFETERDQVNADLAVIIPIINSNGNLSTARRLLWDTTERFIKSVEDIQLTVDIPEQEQDGQRLWRDFNHAWLALFQAQYTRMHDRQQAGQPLIQNGLMTQQTIYDTIIHIAQLARDHVEERGLLDYEWGLWEADITKAADRCMDLFPYS